MKHLDTGWSSIVAAIILWVVCMIGLGFMAHANWKLFMVGWHLWS